VNPLQGFENEVNKCMDLANQLTHLETKYKDDERFRYTSSKLAQYEETKVQREEERKKRRE